MSQKPEQDLIAEIERLKYENTNLKFKLDYVFRTLETWNDAYLAFAGAFDTPVSRLKLRGDYFDDARTRLRDFNYAIMLVNSLQEKNPHDEKTCTGVPCVGMETRNSKQGFLSMLDPCPKCGSGDLAWCSISRRPYCKECNHWGRINYGDAMDAVHDWNRTTQK